MDCYRNLLNNHENNNDNDNDDDDNDNVGARSVMSLPQGSWKTKHLRLKAAWFSEQLELSRFQAYHVPGWKAHTCAWRLVHETVGWIPSQWIAQHDERVCEEKPSGADGEESCKLFERLPQLLFWMVSPSS